MKAILYVIILICAVLMLSQCTNEDEAGRVLKANGYTDIVYTGYKWFACSEDDTYHTGFSAKGPTGVTIEGTVCSGLLFKNSTIRFN